MAKGGGRGRGAPIDSAYDASAVTPNNSTDLPDGPTRALWIGTGGTLKVTLVGSSTVELENVPDGTLLALQVTRVWATVASGTVVAKVIALY